MTNKTHKTHEQQRKFALDVMHDLQSAYDDALVCFHAYGNEHQANFKHGQLLKRLETITKLLEDYQND